MKKGIIYVAIALVCTCALYACNKAIPNAQSLSVSVLWDKTDTMLSKPDSESIQGLYNLTGNQWSGAYFSYASITDVDYNERKYVGLSPESLWSGNELDRKRKVEGFFTDIDSVLQQSENIQTGRVHSDIYRTVINELVRLKSEPSTNHILLIYSDLQENSDLYNVYDIKMLDELQHKPQQVEALYEKSTTVSDLTGIKVYLLFEPKSQYDNRLFNVMSGIYRDILTKHGATVFIQANL